LKLTDGCAGAGSHPRVRSLQESAPTEIYLIRHGETAWSLTGQHTGRTDLALTAHGEAQARGLARRLQHLNFKHVLSSPLRRARRTCELAGFAASAVLDPNLLEWNYGDYEGRTLAEIRSMRPGWELFRDGCPGGESVAQMTERVDQVVSRLRMLEGSVAIFSSGHVLRVLGARWVGAAASLGRGLALDPACICVLGYDHHGADPVVHLWNEPQHDLDRGATVDAGSPLKDPIPPELRR
jgi:broad specificity phosphatase PhoE